jgi:hypothetical protein
MMHNTPTDLPNLLIFPKKKRRFDSSFCRFFCFRVICSPRASAPGLLKTSA